MLAEAGAEGLSVRKISRHVYNACNTLFHPITQEEVHKYVQSYLLKNSKADDPFIEKKRKGVYRLNRSNNCSSSSAAEWRKKKKSRQWTIA